MTCTFGWKWVQRNGGPAGGTFDVTPLRSASNRMQATVPEKVIRNGKKQDLADSMLLVWPKKGNAYGKPIRVNAATTWWAWPSRVEAGTNEATVRVFGENLHLGEEHDPKLLLRVEGGSSRSLEVQSANPYELEGRLPGDLTPGTYRVFAHNGTGGEYGWSEAARFEVVKSRPAPEKVIDVEGGRRVDMEERLRGAIKSATEHGGAVIELPPGGYTVNGPVKLSEDTRVILRGAGRAEWDSETHGARAGRHPENATVIRDHRGLSRPPASFLDLHGAGSVVENMTIVMNSIHAPTALRLRGTDQTVRNVDLVSHSPYTWNKRLIDSSHDGGKPANHVIEDCTIRLMPQAIYINNTDHVRISNCSFYGNYMVGRGTEANAVRNAGGKRMILENCHFQGMDKTEGRVLGRSALFSAPEAEYVRDVYARAIAANGWVPIPACRVWKGT